MSSIKKEVSVSTLDKSSGVKNTNLTAIIEGNAGAGVMFVILGRDGVEEIIVSLDDAREFARAVLEITER